MSTHGLPPSEVSQWKRRIGADRAGSPKPLHLHGRSGVAALGGSFSVISVDDPDAFEVVSYHQQMPLMLANCELSTPRRTIRSQELIAADATELIIVAVHRLDGNSTLRLKQNGRENVYGSGQLVVLSAGLPFSAEFTSVCETALLLIPAEVLRIDSATRSALPIAANTPLARATAQFVRRFTCDASLGTADIDTSAEMAVVDLVQSALGHHDYARRHVVTGPLFVRQAVRDLIEQRYRDPDFTADTIAGTLHMSRRHLYRHFRDADQAPAAMITARRLSRARELLSESDTLTLEQVAEQSGFASSATLRNRFRAEFGHTPGEFRELIVASSANLSMFRPRSDERGGSPEQR